MHILIMEDSSGEIVDLHNLCSDACHRQLAQHLGVEYGGWHGCQESEFDTECVNCEAPIAGVYGPYDDDVD